MRAAVRSYYISDQVTCRACRGQCGRDPCVSDPFRVLLHSVNSNGEEVVVTLEGALETLRHASVSRVALAWGSSVIPAAAVSNVDGEG
jgi:hypothetical protein